MPKWSGELGEQQFLWEPPPATISEVIHDIVPGATSKGAPKLWREYA